MHKSVNPSIKSMGGIFRSNDIPSIIMMTVFVCQLQTSCCTSTTLCTSYDSIKQISGQEKCIDKRKQRTESWSKQMSPRLKEKTIIKHLFCVFQTELYEAHDSLDELELHLILLPLPPYCWAYHCVTPNLLKSSLDEHRKVHQIIL